MLIKAINIICLWPFCVFVFIYLNRILLSIKSVMPLCKFVSLIVDNDINWCIVKLSNKNNNIALSKYYKYNYVIQREGFNDETNF